MYVHVRISFHRCKHSDFAQYGWHFGWLKGLFCFLNHDLKPGSTTTNRLARRPQAEKHQLQAELKIQSSFFERQAEIHIFDMISHAQEIYTENSREGPNHSSSCSDLLGLGESCAMRMQMGHETSFILAGMSQCLCPRPPQNHRERLNWALGVSDFWNSPHNICDCV